MPNTTRTKKAIQDIAKVFNRLASELASDLNQAAKEMEALKREIHRLKASQNRNANLSQTTRKNGAKKAPRIPKARGTSSIPTSHPTTAHSSPPSPSHHESHHESPKPGHESSFVFPNEPLDSSPSQEASSPSNN